jgi:hypothetical protein
LGPRGTFVVMFVAFASVPFQAEPERYLFAAILAGLFTLAGTRVLARLRAVYRQIDGDIGGNSSSEAVEVADAADLVG